VVWSFFFYDGVRKRDTLFGVLSATHTSTPFLGIGPISPPFIIYLYCDNSYDLKYVFLKKFIIIFKSIYQNNLKT